MAMDNVAERLIDAAALSPGIEEWISRQLKAGQKPSQILAELEQGGHVVDRACTAIAEGVGIHVALAAAFVFAVTFVNLGWVLPS